MNTITAKDVKRELSKLDTAVHGDCPYNKTNATLDRFADSLRFEGIGLVCNDNAERDEILGELSGFGNDSYARYLYGD